MKLSWPKKGVVLLELNNPSNGNAMTLTMAQSLAAHIRELKKKPAGDLNVVVLRAAGDHFCASEGPQSWMAGPADLQISFEATVAAYYQVVSACCTMLQELPVPVLAVLHGEVRGAGLALALSASWRVCAEGTSFEFEDEGDLLGLGRTIGQVVGDANVSTLRSEKFSNLRLDSAQAQNVNLVSSVHDTVASAFDSAVALADTIATSPAGGVRNTTSLMKSPVRTHTETTKACVAYVSSWWADVRDGLGTEVARPDMSISVKGRRGTPVSAISADSIGPVPKAFSDRQTKCTKRCCCRQPRRGAGLCRPWPPKAVPVVSRHRTATCDHYCMPWCGSRVGRAVAGAACRLGDRDERGGF